MIKTYEFEELENINKKFSYTKEGSLEKLSSSIPKEDIVPLLELFNLFDYEETDKKIIKFQVSDIESIKIAYKNIEASIFDEKFKHLCEKFEINNVYSVSSNKLSLSDFLIFERNSSNKEFKDSSFIKYFSKFGIDLSHIRNLKSLYYPQTDLIEVFSF